MQFFIAKNRPDISKYIAFAYDKDNNPLHICGANTKKLAKKLLAQSAGISHKGLNFQSANF